jgi:hypothetical protein
VVGGHSAHGADNWRAVNTDSSAALRRRYGHPVVSVPASRSGSNATKWAGHSFARPGRTGTAPGKPVLQPLEREAARGVPYDQFAVQRGGVRQLLGPATSGNAGAISVPRLERSTTRPASTDIRALNSSHFGSLPHPGRKAGSDRRAAGIGSGSVHVTPDPFH